MPHLEEELLTDAELCALLRLKRDTMLRYLRNGPPRRRHGAAAGDIRTIRHIVIGGQRRWVRASVDDFIQGR